MIDTPIGLHAYGAGILSSAAELCHSVRGAASRLVAFNMRRLMRTRFKIDRYQSTYVVVDAFDQLFDATAPDFTPIYAAVRAQAQIEAGLVLPGEREFGPA